MNFSIILGGEHINENFLQRTAGKMDTDYNSDDASKDLQSNKILVAHIVSSSHIDFAEAYLNTLGFEHLRKKNRGFEFASEPSNRHMSLD